MRLNGIIFTMAVFCVPFFQFPFIHPTPKLDYQLLLRSHIIPQMYNPVAGIENQELGIKNLRHQT